jgi:signal transduction histidine kinase
MSDLPSAARRYLYGIWTVAVVAVWLAFSQHSGGAWSLWLLLAALVAFVIADYHVVLFGTESGEPIGMTVTDAMVIFLISATGVYGVVTVIVGSLITDALNKRPWYKGVFNASQRSIIYVVLLFAFASLSDPATLPFTGPWGLLTFLVMATLYHTLNTLIVSTIVALASRQPLLRIYAESFSRVNWVHYITLPFGAILAYFWAANPWLLIPAAFPLLMARRSFQAIAALQEQSRRNEELARQATRLLDELRQKQDELLRSSQLAALGTFSAGIGHEFNNLLTAILGNAQLGLMSDGVGEKNEVLEMIVRASDRGRSITGDLLTFARRREPKREPCDLAVLVADTVDLVQHEFARSRVTITRQLEPVPMVFCDPGQIAQVLLNLLTNARDALADTQGGSILVELRQGSDCIELVVSDTGTGIAPELLPQIFQPFVTTKNNPATGRANGTGLGLAITHGIVESHQGSIEVCSILGEGTTMIVRLPAQPPWLLPPDVEPATETALEVRAVG